MNPWLKSFLIGLLIEAVCIGLMQLGEWGPCGPGTTLGVVLFLIHMPAYFAMAPFSGVTMPEWLFLTVFFVVAAAIWMLLVRGIMALKQG